MPKYLTQIDGTPIKAERSDCDGQGNDIGSTYQPKLTAGSGIAISSGNVISATGLSAESCEFHVLFNADGTYDSLIINAADLADGRALVKGDSADDVYKVALGTIALSDNVTVAMDATTQGNIGDTVSVSVTADDGYRLESVTVGGTTYSYAAGIGDVSLANGLGTTSYKYTIVQGSNLVDVTATAILFNSVSLIWTPDVNYHIRLRPTNSTKYAVGIKIEGYETQYTDGQPEQCDTMYCTSAWSTSNTTYSSLEIHVIYSSDQGLSDQDERDICGFAIYRSNGTTSSAVVCGTSTSYMDSDVYPYRVELVFYVCDATDCTSESSEYGFSYTYFIYYES